jgi:LysR family transcriptional regulator, regulator for bpeEF and oprC
MDKFLAMRAFVRVVDCGSFTQAAETLGMPKASLTRGVQELEAHLHTPLLTRSTRRVAVTPDGALYYDRAVQLLADLDEVEASLTEAGRKPAGRLRVDVAAQFGRTVLIPALGDFHARYPDIVLDVGVGDRPVDLLAEQVDCVLRACEINDLGLVARRVGQMRLVVCATPEYLRRYGTPAHPRDLHSGGFPVVHFFSPRTGQRVDMEVMRGSERVALVGRDFIAVNDSGAYLEAGLAHLGLIYMLDFAVRKHLADGRLVQLFADWQSPLVPLFLACPPKRHHSLRVRVFMDWVTELVARELG